MAGETKWTPKAGDTVWAARFGYLDEVETGSVVVKSATAKQVTLAKMESAFGYSTRLLPTCAGTSIHQTEADAIAALVAAVRRAVKREQGRLAKAEAALSRARGEQP